VAKPIVLYDRNGAPSQDYEKAIANAKAGDVLVFDKETRKEVTGVLGEGTKDKIFLLKNNRALRVPKTYHNAWTVSDYLLGYDSLKRLLEQANPKAATLPLIRVYPRNSRPGRFVEMERLDKQYSLKDLMNDIYEKEVKVPPAEFEKVMIELVEFAKATAILKSVGDLHADNIVHTKRGWVIADYFSDVQSSQSVDGTSILAQCCILGVPEKWQKKILDAVKRERRRLFAPDGTCALPLQGLN
jgi:hypothetical protein